MIVSCGEALVDLVPQAKPGGGPLNVAVAAARLGAPAAFIGRISTDAHGAMILAHLEANGVDLRAVERGPEPTARAIVEHAPQLVFRFEGDDTADMNLTVAELGRLDDEPHILHAGALGIFRGHTAETLVATAESHSGMVSIDPNVRPQIIDDRARWDHYHGRWVTVAHVYKASDEDFDWIWPSRSMESCVEELLAGTPRVVLATRGADGVSIYVDDDRIDVPGRPVDVVDTVGAGDTFVASVLVDLWGRDLAGTPHALSGLGRAEWEAIGERAVAAAAITCSRPGADPPYKAELVG